MVEQTTRYPTKAKADAAAVRRRKKGYRARVKKETQKKSIYVVQYSKRKAK